MSGRGWTGVLVALGAAALLALAAGLWSWRPGVGRDAADGKSPERRRAPVTVAGAPLSVPVARGAEASMPPADVSRVDRLVEDLARLLEGPLDEHGERARQALEAELLVAGEAAAISLIARLDRTATPPPVRERLFDLLRRLPGSAADDRLAQEARQGQQQTMRTMAIEALGQRRGHQALETLTTVARQDPLLLAQPLLGPDRSPDDSSTELPDEAVFTPRMQAMAALAASGDGRAVPVLVDIVRNGPDASLRMEAARNLGQLRSHGRAREALERAAAGDASAVVRLAALHALRGSGHPGLREMLEQIATRDGDAGVRALARELLDERR